ncbi:hypothetical protein [Alkaliphilus metalliredigens]|nr:hypothetical protein [Alkaliphilus metalliredigens]
MPYHYDDYCGMPPQHMDLYEDRRRLMAMYPDSYHRLYPRVQEICGRMDIPSNPRMYPYVDPTLLDEMVEEIYRQEISEVQSEQFTRGPFRDLITILLIQQLLGRRGRRAPIRPPVRPPYRPPYGPWY